MSKDVPSAISRGNLCRTFYMPGCLVNVQHTNDNAMSGEMANGLMELSLCGE